MARTQRSASLTATLLSAGICMAVAALIRVCGILSGPNTAGQMAKHNKLSLSRAYFRGQILATLYGSRVCGHTFLLTRSSWHSIGLLLFVTYFTRTAAKSMQQSVRQDVAPACTRAADLPGSPRQDASCCSIHWFQPPSYPIQALSWTPSTIRGQPTAGETPACPSSSTLPAAITSPLSSPSPGTNGLGSSSCGGLPASYMSLLLSCLHIQISVIGFSCCWCTCFHVGVSIP